MSSEALSLDPKNDPESPSSPSAHGKSEREGAAATPTDLVTAFDDIRALNAAQSALIASYQQDGYTNAEVLAALETFYSPYDTDLWNAFSDGDNFQSVLYNVIVPASDQGGVIGFAATPGLPFVNGSDEDFALVVGSAGNDTLNIKGSLAATLGAGATILFASNGGKDVIHAGGLTTYETIELECRGRRLSTSRCRRLGFSRLTTPRNS